MITLGARKRVYINADGSAPKILRNLAGSTIYYGNSDVSTSSYEGTLAAGSAVMLAQGKWLISAGQSNFSADALPDSDRVVEIDAGNLGATYSLSLGGQRIVWLHGNLTANLNLTVNGVSRTAEIRLFLTQDATGGRTLTITDNEGSLAHEIASAADALSLVSLYAKPDGSVIVHS